jgi:hypothetical protein
VVVIVGRHHVVGGAFAGDLLDRRGVGRHGVIVIVLVVMWPGRNCLPVMRATQKIPMDGGNSR